MENYLKKKGPKENYLKKKGPKMGTRNREIKKIEKISSRAVTFSKRRAGLFKKAEELSVLCDVQVGIIVFSNTGKLYKFACSKSSMEKIVDRYNSVPDSSDHDTIEKVVVPEVDALKAEVAKLRQVTWNMIGKELESLHFKELQQLEHQLTEGLLSIKNKKEQILLEQLEKSSQQIEDIGRSYGNDYPENHQEARKNSDGSSAYSAHKSDREGDSDTCA